LPEINIHTFSLILFIIFGISIVAGLEWYGKKRKNNI